MKKKASLLQAKDGESYLIPFMLVITIFSLWGFALGLMDILNNHFKEILNLTTKLDSVLTKVGYYLGYLVMPIPAAMFLKKFGYKKGIILGLSIYAIGAILFYPAAQIHAFWAFCVALFVISLGMAFLETAASPYAIVLGPMESSVRRLTLAQSFTGIGWILGPLVGNVILSDMTKSGLEPFKAISLPYAGVGILVVMVAILVVVIKLPEINEAKAENVEYTDAETKTGSKKYKSVFQYRHFSWAVFALFAYLVAQAGVNSFFVDYVVEALNSMNAMGNSLTVSLMEYVNGSSDLTDPEIYKKTALILSSLGAMGLFMIGRFAGSFLLLSHRPSKLLAYSSIAAIVLSFVIMLGSGIVAIASLLLLYLFMSSMFPIIFALGLRDLGAHTKIASSYLVMAIGGAFFAYPFMDYINIITDAIKFSYVIPLICFVIVLMFASHGYKKESELK